MKRLTWVLENGEVDCNKSKDECFYLHEEGNGGCWSCDLFPKIIERLAEIENILGEEYDIDQLRELVEADRDGRCVLLHTREHGNDDGENALKSAMNTCYYYNNPVTRYISDAVAEKLVRDSSEPPRINREAWQPCQYCGDYEALPEHIVDGKVVGKVFDACICEDHNGWHIELPHDPDIGIQYCPVCGRPLTDAAWKQLEERLVQK